MKASGLSVSVFVCENILTESDGVNSAIRIVDRTIIKAAPVTPGTVQLVGKECVLFIMIRAGQSTAKEFSLQVRVRGVKGKTRILLPDFKIRPSESGGTNLRCPFPILALAEMENEKPVEGVYWIEILINGELMNKTPWDLSVQRDSIPEQPKSHNEPAA